MKKIAYLDLSSGVSGDMLLAGLIDCGADVKILDEIIDELDLTDVHVEIEDKKDRGIGGKNVKIKYKDQPHRKVSDILGMIKSSDLTEWVKEKSLEAFREIGEIEAEIHDESIEDLELHEVGMVDSIVDIVGSIGLFHDLEIDEAYCSTVSLGSGHTECAHGKIPVPVPATEKLLEGWKVRFMDIEGEMVTPTGAVLLNVLTEQCSPPDMELEKICVGFGDIEREVPNALRIFRGEQKNLDKSIQTLEFYIDDMSPENLEYGLEKIRKEALDVYTTPASGKKNRQGWEVTVLTERGNVDEVVKTIFKETSTLGLRIDEARRLVTERKVEEVETRWGKAQVKVSDDQVSPEYESCKKIAEKESLSVSKVYEKVKENYEKEK